jgi:hypothetical protein
VGAGRLDAAHHLRDDRDRLVPEDVCRVGRQHSGGGLEPALLRRVADERADDAQAVPGRSLDLLTLLLEQAVDRGADRPVAEECYGNVNGRHSRPRGA